MKNFLSFIGLAAIISLAVFVGMSCDELPTGGMKYSGERIGLIHVDGIITAQKSEMSPFMSTGGVSSETIVEQLDEARKDSNIKAVVIRVNSPGGSAAASQEIFNAIQSYRKSGKKLIVSMGDLAASGGYYVSAPADAIYANPGTLVGSIGVIMQLLNYEGLFEKIGLDEVTFKAGKYKDIGSPMREITPQEKEILQNILNEVHKQFKEAVMEGRGMTADEIDKLATGEIWSGRQAKEVGLVDELGGLKDALDRAATEGNLNVDDYVVSPLGEGTILDEILKGFEMRSAPVLPITNTETLASSLFLNQMLMQSVMR
ncbi:MAG: signal peptide peptidase SppA [bacterium]